MKRNMEMVIMGFLLIGMLSISSTGFAAEQVLTPVTSTVDMIKNTFLYVVIPLCIIAVGLTGLAAAFGQLDKQYVFNALIGTAFVTGSGTIVMAIKYIVGG